MGTPKINLVSTVPVWSPAPPKVRRGRFFLAFFGQNPSSAHRIDFGLQHVIPILRVVRVKGSFVISGNIFSAWGVKFCKQIAPTFLRHLRLYRIHNCIVQCTFGWHMWCHCQCRPLTQLLLSSFSAFLQNCVALVAVVTIISYGQEDEKENAQKSSEHCASHLCTKSPYSSSHR